MDMGLRTHRFKVEHGNLGVTHAQIYFPDGPLKSIAAGKYDLGKESEIGAYLV
jgi:hypothetical protein